MKLKDVTFVIFDLETTGLDPLSGDQICEIGAVKVKDKEVLGIFDQLINPLRFIPPEVSALTHITQEMVAKAPFLKEVLPGFGEFIRDTVLVAHNAPYDLSFLAMAFERENIIPPDSLVIDTLTLSRVLYPQHHHHNLDELRQRFNIIYPGAHRGLGDALVTKDLFGVFLNNLQERGTTTLDGLLKHHGPFYRFPTQASLMSRQYRPELIEKLRKAAREQRSVFIAYKSTKQKERTERLVDPYFFLIHGERGYLKGYCHLRQEPRNFRLDRITRFELTEEIFKLKTDSL
jgi:DNA polymerase III epsilon subunit family exonuclease